MKLWVVQSTMYLFFNYITVCVTRKVKKNPNYHSKGYFWLFSRLKWEYVKIMEVQEVNIEV